ncbi:MAG: ClpXP protease specificity-enhancing factor SspB [Cardiobacteriaceae bacterium]|nr:ClpXP protease specificity-enhancing factor SspB [Cardiobacteriaceae bacterium]
MTDQKPYLLRAIYQWIVDNDCTPYLAIARPDLGWVQGVPEHLLHDEVLVLNISPSATRSLEILDDSIVFETRFSGQSHHVWVGMLAVFSLHTRENQEGMSFPLDEERLLQGAKATTHKPETTPEPPKRSSHLKIVK